MFCFFKIQKVNPRPTSPDMKLRYLKIYLDGYTDTKGVKLYGGELGRIPNSDPYKRPSFITLLNEVEVKLNTYITDKEADELVNRVRHAASIPRTRLGLFFRHVKSARNFAKMFDKANNVYINPNFVPIFVKDFLDSIRYRR